MDEIKNGQQQGAGEHGGRKRRRKRHRNGNPAQNQNPQNAQNQAQNQAQNNKNGQKQGAQPTQKGQNSQNNGGQKHNGQKPQNPQNAQKQNNGQKGNQNNQNKQNVKQPEQSQQKQNNQNNRHNGDKKQAGGGQKPQNNGQKQNAPAQTQAQNTQNTQKQNNGQKQQQKQKQKPENTVKQPQNNKKDVYLYALDGNLYVNLTNKCSNGCDFCVRNERDSYYGHNLWLRNGDPTVDKVIAAANGMDLSKYKEVVFCGFGEPTYKVNEMVQLCDFFHGKGMTTRLNTNGQGNLINKRDIVPDLKGKLDLVNISLNFSCAEKYQPVCRSQFGLSGFEGILEFARQCRRNDVNCRFSIVDCIGEDEVEACKRLAESMHIPLYIRDYITDS